MSSSIEEERKGPLSGHGHGRRRATLGLGREHSQRASERGRETEREGLDREVPPPVSPIDVQSDSSQRMRHTNEGTTIDYNIQK